MTSRCSGTGCAVILASKRRDVILRAAQNDD
jgi:hypothetical protein